MADSKGRLLDRIVSRIKSTSEKMAEIRGSNGSAWKEFEDAGFDKQALKLALRMERMERGRRRDFVKSWQAFMRYLKIDDYSQPDMMDEAAAGLQDEDEPADEKVVDLATA